MWGVVFRVLRVLTRYLKRNLTEEVKDGLKVTMKANATAGAIGAGGNLVSQMFQHHTEWRRYDWPSVGFDFCMAAMGWWIARTVFHKWPAPILDSKAKFYLNTDRNVWLNFSKQEAVFAIYFILLWVMRTEQYENSSTVAGIKSGSTEFGGGLSQAILMQSFLFSPLGKSMFPLGYDDPRVVWLDNAMDFLLNQAIREVFGVVPGDKSERSEWGVPRPGQPAKSDRYPPTQS